MKNTLRINWWKIWIFQWFRTSEWSSKTWTSGLARDLFLTSLLPESAALEHLVLWKKYIYMCSSHWNYNLHNNRKSLFFFFLLLYLWEWTHGDIQPSLLYWSFKKRRRRKNIKAVWLYPEKISAILSDQTFEQLDDEKTSNWKKAACWRDDRFFSGVRRPSAFHNRRAAEPSIVSSAFEHGRLCIQLAPPTSPSPHHL